MTQQNPENKFWLKWIINYSLGELLVVGAAITVGRLVMVEAAELMSQAPPFVTPIFMIVIGVIEGLIIGYLQWRSIRLLIAHLELRWWLVATVASTAFGWLVIFRPTIFFIAFFVDFGYAKEYFSFLYTILAGVAFGGAIGFAQFFLLRRFYRNAFAWVFSNTMGWMISFLIIYLSVVIIREAHNVFYNVVIVFLACLCSGLVQGIATGTSLRYLMSAKQTDIKTLNK